MVSGIGGGMAYRDPRHRSYGSIRSRHCMEGGMTFFRGGGLSESTHQQEEI